MTAEGGSSEAIVHPFPQVVVRRGLFETAELAEAESPGTFADAVPVDDNIRARMLAAEVLSPHQTHLGRSC